MPHSLYSGQSD